MISFLGLFIGIILLFFLIINTKIHVFPSLILVSILVGIMAGLSVDDVLVAVSEGFGKTLGSIGMIIGFGCIMGKFLEKSGAAKKIAVCLIRLVGIKNVDVVLGLAGLLVAIPVFCDSGFVVLSQLAKAFSKETKKSMVGIGGMLAMGLYITHFLIPPTPGPLAVAKFFKVDLGAMILGGMLLSIPLFIISVYYFRYVGNKYPDVIPNIEEDLKNLPSDKRQKAIDIIQKSINGNDINNLDFYNQEELPSAMMSFAPVVLPVLLLLLNTVLQVISIELPVVAKEILTLLGNPIVAVFIGLLLSIYGLAPKITNEESTEIIESAMRGAGLIILVTGAGGSLGNVIRVTNLGQEIASFVISLKIPAIFVPLLLGALMRIPQGSGTVAMVTGGSILAPILPTLGLNPLIAALALCSTSMFISYPNDSYFWVVTRFSGLRVETSLKTWSVATAIIPICASVLLIVINALFFI
ncbi:GntP family permease [Clostridiaceae bacterium M8S5]|nr:GntP family permease [Clostridiaceae bacterium M8S5]